jgi:hypothetical protein
MPLEQQGIAEIALCLERCARGDVVPVGLQLLHRVIGDQPAVDALVGAQHQFVDAVTSPVRLRVEIRPRT